MAGLRSRIKNWQYVITWDNPIPPDSSKMLSALGALGDVTRMQTKTTVLLASNKRIMFLKLRKVIRAHLHPVKGNAVYANLKSARTFEYGKKNGYHWKRVK